MDVLDRVYYTRAILGVIAGVIAGLVIIPGTDQGEVMGIIILTALVFYLLSYYISRRIGLTILKSHKRKLATDGIFSFYFSTFDVHDPGLYCVTPRTCTLNYLAISGLILFTSKSLTFSLFLSSFQIYDLCNI